MEPNRQMEIQLGHMCNNRCVFCVSGQRTELREAFPLQGDPIVAELERGYASGIRKVTLLGGEPTLQPEFFRVLRTAVALGFEEIVVFTNGVKTSRASFVDEILATGGNITWRLSFQGADRESHERTTRKPGSFRRLVSTLENLRERNQRITVNMCVVRSNFESVSLFPELLLPHGVTQLHLDMVRPLDAGKRTEAEMRDMLPFYSDMTPHLTRMISGFPAGFDVNIGNLPYCIAPDLAPWIRHDGEHTLTIAIDEDDRLSDPWDKYEVKRRDKLKPSRCGDCVFDGQCSGVFETYREFYGLDELRPISAGELPRIDPDRTLFPLHVESLVSHLVETWVPPAPFGTPGVRRDSRAREVVLTFPVADSRPVRVAFRPPGGGFASNDRFSLHCLDTPAMAPERLASFLHELVRQLGTVSPSSADSSSVDPSTVVGNDVGGAAGGESGTRPWIHPPGDDAVFVPEAGYTGGIDPVLGRRLRQLRESAPFGSLQWRSTSISADGKQATLGFTHDAGSGITVRLSSGPRGLSGSYRLEGKALPSEDLAGSVRTIFDTLRSPLPPLRLETRPPAPPPPPADSRMTRLRLPVVGE